MRGRKLDSEFLCNFITECIKNNKCTNDDILNEAKFQIENIDNKIKEIEKLKPLRSKLMDVVLSFDKPHKDYQEIKIISLFDIPNQHICKFICDKLKKSTVYIDELKKSEYNQQELMFTIKQLIEKKILSKAGNVLVRGELYNDYVKTVLNS